MNALTLLKQDHGNVESLFKRYEALGDDDGPQKKEIVEKVSKELSKHAEAEEQVFYPKIRPRLEAQGIVLEALEEHHLMKVTLNELEKLPTSNERYDAKVTVLMENTRHHVKEEEEELFDQVRKHFKANELEEMGERMEQIKKAAPARPHPFSPDVPPFNIILGPATAVIDRMVNTGKDLVTKVLNR